MDKIAENSLLFDFYGQLLTEKKQEFMRLYHEDNLSLGEIAEEFGISRAAVHDSIKSSERALAQYEEKLRLVQRFVKTHQIIEQIDSGINQIIEDKSLDEKNKSRLLKLKSIIDTIDEEI